MWAVQCRLRRLGRLIVQIAQVVKLQLIMWRLLLSKYKLIIRDPNDLNDNAPGWSQLPLLRVFQISDIPIQSNDEVDYTIYFLSDGSNPINNVRFCDPIPDGTTFTANSIQAVNGTTPINGNFFSPLAPLPAGNTCSNPNNPNRAVLVDLGNLSNVAGSNFGFVRFRVKIN